MLSLFKSFSFEKSFSIKPIKRVTSSRSVYTITQKIFFPKGVVGIPTDAEMAVLTANLNNHGAHYKSSLTEITPSAVNVDSHLALMIDNERHFAVNSPTDLARVPGVIDNSENFSPLKSSDMFNFMQQVQIRADNIFIPTHFTPISKHDIAQTSDTMMEALQEHLDEGTRPPINQYKAIIKIVSKELLSSMRPHEDILPSLVDLCSMFSLNPTLTALVVDNYVLAAVGPTLFIANFLPIFLFQPEIFEECRDETLFKRRFPFYPLPTLTRSVFAPLFQRRAIDGSTFIYQPPTWIFSKEAYANVYLRQTPESKLFNEALVKINKSVDDLI
jgi:hypothetical protein